MEFLSLLTVASLFGTSKGGNCWIRRNSNGLCGSLIEMEVSREKCCGFPGTITYFSDTHLSPSFFFYSQLQGGVPCSKCQDGCEGVDCGEGYKCAVRPEGPKCVCAPNCTAYRLTHGIMKKRFTEVGVCGSDGKTYKSVCRLLKRACRINSSTLTVAYYSPCKLKCGKITCPAKRRCLLDQNSIPHCVSCRRKKCRWTNPVRKGRRVCGADGETYPTMCHLREAACTKGRAIPLAYKGPCKKGASCSDVKCDDDRVCLHEPLTGRARCVYCGYGICNHKTGNDIGPICGTDNRTYKSWCKMKMEGCRGGIALDTKHFGDCESLQMKNLMIGNGSSFNNSGFSIN